MAKTPYALRKIPFARNRSLARHAKTVGQLIYASNYLHALFSAIFSHLVMDLGNEDRWAAYDVSRSIWHSLRSDDVQRTVLLGVVRTTMESKPRTSKSLLWALDKAGKLSEYRNDAVHTPFDLVFSSRRPRWEIEPDYSAGLPSRVAKLTRVGHQKLFRLALGDLVQLANYVEGIYSQLADEEPKALPRRPVLRSIQLVQKSPPRSNARQQRKPTPRA
jgi:hypothetical protein